MGCESRHGWAVAPDNVVGATWLGRRCWKHLECNIDEPGDGAAMNVNSCVVVKHVFWVAAFSSGWVGRRNTVDFVEGTARTIPLPSPQTWENQDPMVVPEQGALVLALSFVTQPRLTHSATGLRLAQRAIHFAVLI